VIDKATRIGIAHLNSVGSLPGDRKSREGLRGIYTTRLM
jgi:hypothetical protein